MSKFIDADRLRTEIEHLRCVQRTIGDRAINSSMRRFYEGTEDMCNQFLSLIDSLQQEQPATATGRVFTNTDPMNLYVERDQWAALLGQFENGQRVRIILVKEDEK